ncbi:D-alanyl-D-alanine endopeptidase [Massilia glaciei]|uniref:D-alanyl-D-alanine endopeptidase n=1 Tax=Massilia glaciei TaxID=1524097 RepID=A0A2U2I6Y8_9BURK|nr:D-alanyl-D-alanine endopeptidase [Massilia glaciei]PWF55455.1 D-alanyl-D-alanine endopeptidase [Massilia glaciei]
MFKLALSALLSMLFFFAPAPVEAKAGAGASSASKKVQKAQNQKRVTRKVLTKRKAARAQSARRTVKYRGGRKQAMQRVVVSAPARSFMTMGDRAGLNLTRDPLDLKSSAALVLDQASSEVLFEKNANIALPIASITKLMTGLIVVQAKQDMNELLTVSEDDIDHEKGTGSRLRIGTQLSRGTMLHLALMSSENRAASVLGRYFPGGRAAFVAAMNTKAQLLGMRDTRYVDTSGLSSRNVASARDLARLVVTAHTEPLLRQYSTDPKSFVDASGRTLQYSNTNHLVANPEWDIGLQKTGFINEAGRCLVMQTMIQGRAVVMVFLDSKGKQSRTADAGRIRKWLEAISPPGM